MIVLLALCAEMGWFGNTIEFSLISRGFLTIITERMFRLPLFMLVYREINKITWIYLIIFEDSVLVYKYLRGLLFAVKINWIKSFRKIYSLVSILSLGIAIRFTHCNFTHHETELFLSTDIKMPIIANIKNHSILINIKTFLDNLLKSIVINKLICFQKWFQDDTPFCIVAEWCTHMSIWNIVDTIYHDSGRPQGKL